MLPNINALKLEDLEIFLEIARRLSLTQVANHSGLPKSTVSRRLAQIEDHLGTRLINRTTRQVRLTDAGAQLKNQLEELLPPLLDCLSDTQDSKNVARGRLSIKIPVEAVVHLQPVISRFTEFAPDIELDIHVTNRAVDLVKEGLDASIEFGPLESSAYIARALGKFRRVVVAAPSYLEKAGVPKNCTDIQNHNCILRRDAHGVVEQSWNLEGADDPIDVTGTMTVDNELFLRELATFGHGLALLSEFSCQEALKNGSLIACSGMSEKEKTLYAIYHSKIHKSAALDFFLDFAANWTEALVKKRT